ncbi:MAG TPA: ABC transporter permease subunit [Candidatus Limnocylindrales bacterium]|nr:ABC transporter permease subunit [Candidatus Limnocylindrales bacterium]
MTAEESVIKAPAGDLQQPHASEALGADPGLLRSLWASITAVFAKEARWRMRGRRAFVVMTVYVALLGLLVLAVYQLIYDRSQFQFGFNMARVATDQVSGNVSASIGQAIFTAILILQTLLTMMLAPALTSGAISAEREKQTMDLLITTPVSTLGLVLGKLVSSLAFVLLLIVASVPLMSLVFAFGGVAPEDVIRAYVVLFVMAFGIGSIGMLMSAVFKRTQVATAVAYLIAFVLTIGTLAFHTYLTISAQAPFNDPSDVRPAPEALLWLNPLVTDIDLLCTAIPDTFGFTCSYIAMIQGNELGAFAEQPRDSFWPKSALAFALVGIGATLLTTQLIAPSRRLRGWRGRADAAPVAAADAPP